MSDALALDNLTDDALSLAMELKRLEVGLCTYVYDPGAVHALFGTPEWEAAALRHQQQRLVCAALRQLGARWMRADGRRWLLVMYGSQGPGRLTRDQWARLRRHRSELWGLIAGERRG